MSTNVSALGRLGVPVGGPHDRRGRRRRRRRMAVRQAGVGYVATPQPRVPRSLRIAGLVASAMMLWVGVMAQQQTGPQTAVAAAPARPPAQSAQAGAVAATGVDGLRYDGATDRASRSSLPGAAGLASAPAAGMPVFAEVDGLPLVLPHAAPVSVAFHEAARPEALELLPVGSLLRNDNPTKYTVADVAESAAGEVEYRVLSSRGRPRPATSAVDVVVPEGGKALSPVDGTVVEVRQYALYSETQDWRVVIAPDGRPDLRVVLIHLHQPAVTQGQRVLAGATPVAAVRLLPFPSHVDYVLERSLPHVHLEVKPALAEEPADPNAPASPAPSDAL